jgi:predicted DNA-binding transcriptional regulator AlpA
MVRRRRFLTKKQVARLLEVAPRTVDRLVADGHLVRPLEIGGQLRWLPLDVKVYVHLLQRGFFRQRKQSDAGRGEAAKARDNGEVQPKRRAPG